MEKNLNSQKNQKCNPAERVGMFLPPNQRIFKPTVEQMRDIVEAARHAPSGDNAQPFSYEWNGTELIVREDVDRSRAFLNVGNVPSQIALGMGMANIDVVAERLGWKVVWHTSPQESVVARASFQSMPPVRSLLEEAIPKRTVDRRPYLPSVLSAEFVNDLSRTHSNARGVRLLFVRKAEKMDELASLCGGFESFLFEHRASHDFLFRWLRHSDKRAQRTGDGMPVSTLALGWCDRVNLRLLGLWVASRLCSWLGLNRLAARRARRVYRQSAGFGAFAVPKNDAASLVDVGRLWQQLWLKLTREGWSLQPLFGSPMMALLARRFRGEGLSQTQKERFLSEDYALRRIFSVSEEENIVCLFRVGRPAGPVVARAPRRPLERVLNVVFPNPSVPTKANGFDYQNAFSRNLGLVQPSEQNRLRQSVVAVAGLGGVGGVHVTTLARMGIGRLHVADFDRFEIHNFNRQVGATLQTIGKRKVDVMAQQALAINPQAEVRRFSQGVTRDNVDEFLDGVDVVVDGLDFFSPQAREVLYDAAERRGIPLVTAGPIGLSVAWLVFMPGAMKWRDYFQFNRAKSTLDQLILFALGLTPRATHMDYIDREYVNLSSHQGPSMALAVELCAGVAAGEVLKLLLGRGKVAAAPHFNQFDVYKGRLVTGTLRWGNAGWLQRIKFHLLRHWVNNTPK